MKNNKKPHLIKKSVVAGDNLNDDTIDLPTATQYVQNWINLCNDNILKPAGIQPTLQNLYKGFWIPIEDIAKLADSITINGWNGATAYLALDDSDNTLKGIIVPCNYDLVSNSYRDAYFDPQSGNSLIYDFTCPCPQQCDLTGTLGSLLPDEDNEK